MASVAKAANRRSFWSYPSALSRTSATARARISDISIRVTSLLRPLIGLTRPYAGR